MPADISSRSPSNASDGKANKEIAAQLALSEDTVKRQVHCILAKLGVKDRTHAAMVGVRHGIIEL